MTSNRGTFDTKERIYSRSYEANGEKKSYSVTIHEVPKSLAGRVLSKPVNGKSLASGDQQEGFVIMPRGPKRLGVGTKIKG